MTDLINNETDINETISIDNTSIIVSPTPTPVISEISLLDKYYFLDNDFISNQENLNLFDEMVNHIKLNFTTNSKTPKISVCFVGYKLMLGGIITNSESMILEINKFVTHITNNFNQYNIDFFNKFSQTHKFIKFSNNYLLENYEQIYKV